MATPRRLSVCSTGAASCSTGTPLSESTDTACEKCGSQAGHNILLCDFCDRGWHTSCLGLGKVPEAAKWFCPHCDKSRPVQRFKSSARVCVHWDEYGDCIGWVIGVEAPTEDDLKNAEKNDEVDALYHVFYNSEDIQWQFLKTSDFIKWDVASSALAKEADPLLGARIEVYHEQSSSVVAGWYAGIVSDVRVERLQRFAEKTIHLVRYDAKDVHWHDLAHVRYRREDLSQRKIKAAFGVNAVGGPRGVKRTADEVAAEAAEAKAAREARHAAAAAEELEAQWVERGLRQAACQRLEQALLVDTPSAPPSPTAKFAAIKARLEASRGEQLAGALRELKTQEVPLDFGEVLKSSGVGKLVGTLARLTKESAITMAGSAAEAVQAAAEALMAAWFEQVTAQKNAPDAGLPLAYSVAAGEDSSKAWATRAAAQEKALAIVECIYEGIDAASRNGKLRMLRENLSKPTNGALRTSVLRGELAPERLVQMSHVELAPPEMQIQRQVSMEAAKRAVTILDHAQHPFGIEEWGKTFMDVGRRALRDSTTPEQLARDHGSGGWSASQAVEKEDAEGGLPAAARVSTTSTIQAVEPAAMEAVEEADDDDDDEVEEVGEVTRAERDAKARAEAVSLLDSDEEDSR